MQLPTFEESHRLLHIHENVPGILAQINALFSGKGINIQAQYLKTFEDVGYVITDIATGYPPDLPEEIRQIPHTIHVRMLY